ncbi:hypothetical protein DFH07DRAFT_957947 [Mycena maculata]|uniref:C2H2-type domain-containing protein n=1 Tax=Mycena maculata TaxID=230809 RepID=A0AAD7NF03_9AGAR|nr:hypothetical protein DFH07DRAFT_957947 [Mycena maculata]
MDIKIEREFCSNFKCCDVELSDLHALYEHLEMCHQDGDIRASAVPASGSASTYSAVSDFLQLPVSSSTPPPLLSAKLKTLLTRIPRDEVPPLSPTVSDSASSSASSASTPEPSSASSYGSSFPCSQKQIDYPSNHTRDKIYTPVTVPPTRRMEQPQPQMNAHALGWNVSAQPPFWSGYPSGLGYAYGGYGYYPPSAPNVPRLPPMHAPVYPQPDARASLHAIEFIDIDLVSPPTPPYPNESSPSTTLRSASWSFTGLPPPPAPPSPVLPGPSPSSAVPSPRTRVPSIAERRAAAGTAFVTVLRRRFFGRSIVVSRTEEHDVETTIGDLNGGAMDVDSEVVAVAPEAVGGGDKALEIEPMAAANETSQNESAPKKNKNKDEMTADNTLDPKSLAADDTPAPPHICPRTGKTIIYLGGKQKVYICPVPLCVKSYLNPGGLRYHREQGTCVMKGGKPCPRSTSPPVSDAATSSASAGSTATSATTSEATAPEIARRRPTRRCVRYYAPAPVVSASKKKAPAARSRKGAKAKASPPPADSDSDSTSDDSD